MNCSKTKNTRSDFIEYLQKIERLLPLTSSFADFLDKQYRQQLIKLQQQVEDQKTKTMYKSVDHQRSMKDMRVSNGNLPAFLRYSGRVFQNVHLNSWINALLNPTMDIWILTAFRGIVRYTESLPRYDLTIHDKLFSGKSMRRWWREHSLTQIIWNAIENVRPQEIIIIASKSYQPLLPLKEILQYNSQFEVKIPSFPGGMGSLHHKGRWLDAFLSGNRLELKKW